MFFLILLKRAKVPVRDIISFYPTCIRPVLEYCAPSFFFEPIVSNTEHKRPHFFPPKNHITYNLRNQRQFVTPIMHTKRLSQTYLPAMCRQ